VSSDKDLMQLVSDKIRFYDFESGAKGKPGYRPERNLDREAIIAKARSRSCSRLPYSLMSAAAVFRPMPGTPGTLSEVSPISASASPICSGARPSHLAMIASRSRLRSGR
jgi:hypothetical protein